MIALAVERKEMNRGENAANKRFGKLQLEELENQRAELEALVQQFKNMELAIKAFRYEKENLRVDGITKFQRGLSELQTYIQNVHNAIKVHRHGEVY